MKDRPRALAVLIAVFLVGSILGASGSYFWLKQRQEPAIRTEGPFTPRRPPEGLRLPELLDMTPEQKTRFDEIMAESWKELQTLRAEQNALRDRHLPRIRAIRANMNRQISAILNSDEQRKKFDNFVKEMENRRRSPGRRGSNHAPPRP